MGTCVLRLIFNVGGGGAGGILDRKCLYESHETIFDEGGTAPRRSHVHHHSTSLKLCRFYLTERT